MAKLPAFATEMEAAEWFATHDTAPYMLDLEVVAEKIAVRRTRLAKRSVGLRLRADYLDAIKLTAERRGIPYQALLQAWLIERLH